MQFWKLALAVMASLSAQATLATTTTCKYPGFHLTCCTGDVGPRHWSYDNREMKCRLYDEELECPSPGYLHCCQSFDDEGYGRSCHGTMQVTED